MTYPAFSNIRIHPLTNAISGRAVTEDFTVAELVDDLPGVYGVQLTGIPKQGTLTVTDNASGGGEFVQVTGLPLVGQVGIQFVDLINERGLIIFNVADSGKFVNFAYDDVGTVASRQGIDAIVEAAIAASTDRGFLAATSSQLTTGTPNAWQQMTGNSIVIPTGSRLFYGAVALEFAGGGASYSQLKLGWFAANGDNTNGTPTGLSIVTAGLAEIDADSVVWVFGTGAAFTSIPVIRVRVTTASETVFLVPHINYSGNNADVRVTTYIIAEEVFDQA